MAKIRLEWVRPEPPRLSAGRVQRRVRPVFSGQQTLHGFVLHRIVRSGNCACIHRTRTALATNAARAGAGVGAYPAPSSCALGRTVRAYGERNDTVCQVGGRTGLRLFSVDTGDALAFIEALDTPGARLVQDATAEAGLQSILTAVQGTLAVSGPLTNAQAAALGLGTSANQAAILAALQSPLLVTASPIHAVATARSGTLGVGDRTAQDLMPA